MEEKVLFAYSTTHADARLKLLAQSFHHMGHACQTGANIEAGRTKSWEKSVPVTTFDSLNPAMPGL